MDDCIERIIQRLPFEYNDYNFLSFIGKGTYSVVFEVTKSSWKNRRCAAKITYTDESFDLESGYLHEAELDALMSLEHPNIIRLFDYFISTNLTLLEATYEYEMKNIQDQAKLYELSDQLEKEKIEFANLHNYVIVMILNYCPFGTLEEYFNDSSPFALNDLNSDELTRKTTGKRTFMLEPSLNLSTTGMNLYALTFLQNLTLFSNVVSALHVCHSHGIAHRDLKPANIFIDNYKQAIVADFGLASIQTNSVDTACGSPFYCAPEIFMTGVAYDPFPADIFALGVTAYQVFTGFLPYSEQQLRSGQIDNSKLELRFPGFENDYIDECLIKEQPDMTMQMPEVTNSNPLHSLTHNKPLSDFTPVSNSTLLKDDDSTSTTLSLKNQNKSCDRLSMDILPKPKVTISKTSSEDFFGSQERRYKEKKEARQKLANLIIAMLHKDPLKRPTIEVVNQITKEVNNSMNPPKRNRIRSIHNKSMHQLMNQKAAMNFLLKASETAHQKKKLSKNFQVSSSLNNINHFDISLINPPETIYEEPIDEMSNGQIEPKSQRNVSQANSLNQMTKHDQNTTKINTAKINLSKSQSVFGNIQQPNLIDNKFSIEQLLQSNEFEFQIEQQNNQPQNRNKQFENQVKDQSKNGINNTNNQSQINNDKQNQNQMNSQNDQSESNNQSKNHINRQKKDEKDKNHSSKNQPQTNEHIENNHVNNQINDHQITNDQKNKDQQIEHNNHVNNQINDDHINNHIDNNHINDDHHINNQIKNDHIDNNHTNDDHHINNQIKNDHIDSHISQVNNSKNELPFLNAEPSKISTSSSGVLQTNKSYITGKKQSCSVPPQTLPRSNQFKSTQSNLEKALKQKSEYHKSQQVIKKSRPYQSIPHVPSSSAPFFSHNPKISKSPSSTVSPHYSRYPSVNQGHRSSLLPVPNYTTQPVTDRPYKFAQVNQFKMRAGSVNSKNHLDQL